MKNSMMFLSTILLSTQAFASNTGDEPNQPRTTYVLEGGMEVTHRPQGIFIHVGPNKPTAEEQDAQWRDYQAFVERSRAEMGDEIFNAFARPWGSNEQDLPAGSLSAGMSQETFEKELGKQHKIVGKK